MKNLNTKIKLTLLIFILVLSSITIFYFLVFPKENSPILHRADLIIYTPLSNNLYTPIIKEFQERNNVYIEIREENTDSIMTKLKTPSSFDGDIILGIHNDLVEENKDYFASHTTLNSTPFVVAFNNHLLTSNEQIKNYNCLTKPNFKGKIGFIDPELSAVYEKILNIMAQTSHDSQLFKQLFIENTKDHYLESAEDINLALKNGTISVAITSEQSAILLSRQSTNINYLNRYDCIINFDIALPNNSSKTKLATDFYEFTTSNDAKRFISSYLNNNIGDKAYEMD